MRKQAAWIAAIVAVGCSQTTPPLPAPPAAPAIPQPAILATETIGDELVVRQIEARTWVVTHRVPFPANSLVAEGDDGALLLVDTPWTPEATATLLDWFETKLGPRKLNGFITHYHLHALGGLPELRRRRVGTRAHGAIEDLLLERRERHRQALIESLGGRPELAERFRNAELLQPPSLYAAGRFGLPFGSERYTLVHPGPSHSPDCTTVHLENRRILYAGWAVSGDDHLGDLADADLEAWPAALDELASLDATIVVPGHGERLDPGLIEHTRKLVDRARAAAAE